MSEEVTNVINDINLDEYPGSKELLAILTLPEEQFSALAPIFLQLLEEELNKLENRSQLINAAASKPIASIQEFRKHLEDNVADELSQIKIDFLIGFYSIIYNIAQDAKKENNIAVAIERCHPDAMIPTYASEGDAGMDVYAIEDTTILPGETKLIKTGIKVVIPNGYELQVRPRSGQSLKTKLRIANAPGTIDSGYRDEIGIIAENIDNPVRDITFHYEDDGKLVVDSIATGAPVEVVKGQRIAQLVLAKVYHANLYRSDNVKELGGDRGGGFGHSGK